MTLFLNDRRDINFISYNSYKDYDTNTGKYLFFECEQRMWRLGNRTLQYGVQYGGGGDWFILGWQLVAYMSDQNNLLMKNLIAFFNFTSSPLEV